MIHKTTFGHYVISSHGVWLQGAYEDERTARFAFKCEDEMLSSLQMDANTRAGSVGGVITWGDIAKARSAGRLKGK